jgi:hypothetical protein
MPPSRLTVSASRRAALASAGAFGLALATRGVLATTQDATPVTTTFSTFGHPMVGTWQWTNFPGTAHEFFSFGTFNDVGGYVESTDPNVAFGTWRATGERTAEVVMIPGVVISLQAAFEPQYVIAETCLVTRDPDLYRVMIEIDATGNRMTATGWVELQGADNSVIQVRPYEGIGERMTIASQVPATPSS